MAKSIYDIISENVGSDGRLPKGFRLPETIETPDGENYVPGARDSLEVYSNPLKSTDGLTQIIYADMHKYNWDGVLSTVMKYGAKQIQDSFNAVFGLMYSAFDLPSINKFARVLLLTSDSIEYVKFAITLIGTFDMEISPKLQKQLETLALFDEFTYYVVSVAKRTPGGYDIILRVAQKVDGWGKIEAVKKLVPHDRKDLKDWLLRYGCENRISETILGLMCAKKGDLPTALSQATLDPDLYNGIAIIINALLSDVNEKGMSKYSKANDAIPLYVKHAQTHATTIRHFWFLMNLKASIDTFKLTNKSKKEATTLCNEICNTQTCTDLVLSTLSQPDNPDFQYACDMALALGMDITEQIKGIARAFPIKDTWTPPTFEPWTPSGNGNWAPPPPPERTKREETTPKTKSIYDIICENLTPQGCLPSDFVLPYADKGLVPGEISFVRNYPNTLTEPEKIAEQLLDYILQKQYQNVLAIVKRYYVAQFDTEFKSIFHRRSEVIDIQEVWKYGLSLAFKSTNIEAVKLGIVIISLFNIRGMEGVVNSLLDLAKYDEFTFEVICVVKDWDDGNDFIFQIAQNVNGWGKLFALFLLQPETQQIRDWVLRYGCENNISNYNLAPICAEKGDLIGALRRVSIDAELYNGIAYIINMLVVNDSDKGLRGYKDAEECLNLYLGFAHSCAVSLKHFWYLVHIDIFMDRYDFKSKDTIRHQCKEIYDTQRCRDLVAEALSGNDDTEYNHAFHIANVLGIATKGHIRTDAKKTFFKTLHALNPSDEKSIYEIICESVGSDGRLPDDFTLPNWKVDPSGIRFRAGNFDGGLYFFPQADDPKRVARQLVDAVQSKNEVEIVSIVGKYGVIQYWDYFMREYTQRANELDAKFIYNYATFLAFELADIELVKLGISLLCVFMLTDVHHARTQLETLALFDEFTFFVVENLEVWENGNDSIFKIAQKVDGWGKIYAVKSLKPETQEIKDWLLRQGCKNDVSNSKLALECATKGDLIGVLQSGRVDAELFDKIAILIDALLGEMNNMGIRIYKSDEEPEKMPTELAEVMFDEDDDFQKGPKGLEDYQYAEEAVTIYLQLAEKYAVSVNHLWYLSNLVTALESSNIPSKDELIRQCCKICDTQATRDLILAALSDPKSREFFRAMQLAEGLAMDITDYLYKAVKADPLKNSVYLPMLFHIPEYAQELTALYESVLPLEQMKTGMGDLLFAETLNSEHHTLEILLGQLAAYPNMGSSLVKAALYSPITRERNFACRVLTAWCDKLGKPLSDVSLALYIALADTVLKEVNPKTKATMCKILGLDVET